MSDVGQKERVTQNRVVKLFSEKLNYTYLGDWSKRENNKNIEIEYLTKYLKSNGVNDNLITKTLRELSQASAMGGGKKLYEANKAIYALLRYGVKVKEDIGSQTKTVWLIDWKNPLNNNFYIAEEVSVKGENNKRPDIVIYVNGIALGVLELKRASETVSKGIRQNIDNQNKIFIRDFFTTMQLVMAGNDSEGLRYATIETPEKYYLNWREENPEYNYKIDTKDKRYLPNSNCENGDNILDCSILKMLNKERFLEIIHNFILFDAGIKKICRHNQYFGVKEAQKYIKKREGGIIWHTQGSGKSITMVWLAKWIRENITDSRVLIITDRTELDEQIEGIFEGVDEQIYRTSNGNDLISTLNINSEWLICSLIHKFGNKKDSSDEFIKELQKNIPTDFKPKGEIFVFVDECHRTQSGELHKAMKNILPNSVFIGFTGTPLLKDDKQKSIEVFGEYIHTYKFDEALKDKVILDLQYEARDIEQYIKNHKKIDEWFDVKTKGLSDIAKMKLKRKWGTLQKVLSSKSRLEQIVNDILMDMNTKDRLMSEKGNAILVCDSIYEACKIYELFDKTDLNGKCAIITSYTPSIADIKGESQELQSEKLKKYDIYRKMLSEYFEEPEDIAMNKTKLFEEEIKKKFVKSPAKMKLLIVVDKLLTGFDAPSATYLYINKKLRDHGLFQAICRVNRLDGEDKDYGYIVDYKDLFKSLEKSINDYTSEAFDNYEKSDIEGLLSNRLEKSKERLEDARERVKALCEPVKEPKNITDYNHYFCAEDTLNKNALKDNEPKRVALYKGISSLTRAYVNLANEMEEAGYSKEEFEKIKAEVKYFQKIKEEVEIASGDYIDMKMLEPAMRHLIDAYIKADDSEVLTNFDNMSLLELIVKNGIDSFKQSLPKRIREDSKAMAETIENNMRKLLLDKNPVNPKYYDKMSELLDEIIKDKKNGVIEYKEYLEKIRDLASKSTNPNQNNREYPKSLNSIAKRALYDNLDKDEELAIKIDKIIKISKEDSWIGNMMKERKISNAIKKELGEKEDKLKNIMELIKNQNEYR